MSKELTLLLGEIDRVFGDLVDLDNRISKATGRELDFGTILEMKHELANNARRVFCLSIEEMAYNDVIHYNKSIAETAKKFAKSPSTIRRWLDKVTEERA